MKNSKPAVNRRYAVGFLHNGKFSEYVCKRLNRGAAIKLAESLNDYLSGSPLIAIVVPHAMKGYTVGAVDSGGQCWDEFISRVSLVRIQSPLLRNGQGGLGRAVRVSCIVGKNNDDFRLFYQIACKGCRCTLKSRSEQWRLGHTVFLTHLTHSHGRGFHHEYSGVRAAHSIGVVACRCRICCD